MKGEPMVHHFMTCCQYSWDARTFARIVAAHIVAFRIRYKHILADTPDVTWAFTNPQLKETRKRRHHNRLHAFFWLDSHRKSRRHLTRRLRSQVQNK